MRGTYYMHTAYVPNPTVVHPTFGSVVSYELGKTGRNWRFRRSSRSAAAA